MKKGTIILVLVFITAACGDVDTCNSDSSRSSMTVRFFDIDTKEAKKVGFIFTAENSPYQFIFDADTVINADTITSISSDSTVIVLPLNALDTSSRFFFDTDTIDHILEVRYDVQYSIFDPECDPSIVFTGLDTLSSSFDSTVVTGNITDRQLTTNIEVYF